MSLFGKLFGRKRTKIGLIRDLAKYRICNDNTLRQSGLTADVIDSEPDLSILGLPEATLVTIVETYIGLKKQGVPDTEIFSLIEAHRALLIESDALPSRPTLRSYISYRLSLEHNHGFPFTDIFLDYSIQEAEKYFEGA